MEQVAKVPHSFRLRARNPERSLTVGEGGTPVWMNVGGPPFASDLDEGRRSGRIQDHDALVKLTQATDVLNCVQTGACEATDLQMESRHMDQEYSTIRWSDKPYTTYGTSGPRARDGIRMAEIVHGGREAIEAEPALLGIVNPNSPLIWDFRMTDALIAWAEANAARGGDPVPAGRRHVGGERGGRTHPAGRRGAVGRRARAGRSRGRAVPLRIVLHRHGHADRFAGVRDARVGVRCAGGRADGAALRATVPRRRRAGVVPGGGCAGRGGDPDDAVGHDARRHRRGAARRGMARGGPHGLRSRSSRWTWNCSGSSSGRWKASASPRRSSRSTR